MRVTTFLSSRKSKVEVYVLRASKQTTLCDGKYYSSIDFPHDLIFMTKITSETKLARNCFHGNHGNRMINKKANLTSEQIAQKETSQLKDFPSPHELESFSNLFTDFFTCCPRQRMMKWKCFETRSLSEKIYDASFFYAASRFILCSK